MKIQIQAIQFTADQKLVNFIERKLQKLEQFFDRIIDAEVYLSLDSRASHIKDKVVKIKVNVPGSQVIATESSKIFEEAVDMSVHSLKRQIKRYKDKVRG